MSDFSNENPNVNVSGETPASEPLTADAEQGVVGNPVENSAQDVLQDTPKKKLPRSFWVLIPVIAVPLLAVVIWYIWATSPKVLVEHSVAGFISGMQDEPLIAAFNNAMDGGQVRVELDNDAYLEHPLVFDLYSKQGSNAASAFRLTYGDEFISAYLSKKDIAVSGSPTGGTAYGFSPENFYSEFEKSIFFPGSGSAYALPLSDDQLEMLRELNDKLNEDPEETRKQSQKIVKKYYKLTEKLLFRYGELTSETASGDRVVTLVMDEEAISKFVRDFYKEMKADKELIALVDDVYFDEESLNSYISRLLFGRGSSLGYDSFADILDEVGDGIEDICDRIERQDLEITLKVISSGPLHKLRKLELTVELNNDPFRFTLDLTEKDTMQIKVKAGTEQVTVQVARTDEGYSAYFRVASDGSDLIYYTATMTLEGENYKLRLKQRGSDEEVLVRGRLVEDKKHFIFSVKSVSIGGETADIGLTLEFIAKADMPAIPKYENVFSMREEDIDDLGKTLQEWAQGFAHSFGGEVDESGSLFASGIAGSRN